MTFLKKEDFLTHGRNKLPIKKGGPIHEAPTRWALGRAGTQSHLVSEEVVSWIWTRGLQIARQQPHRCAKARPLTINIRLQIYKRKMFKMIIYHVKKRI